MKILINSNTSLGCLHSKDVVLHDDAQKISRPHASGFDGVVVVRKA